LPTIEEEAMEKVTAYLSSVKSDKTRDGAKEIVEFLLKKRDEQRGGGWTRSGEIYKALHDHIPNPNTLTRLLKDLVEAKIIDRRNCQRVKGRAGKAPVFYQVPQEYNPWLFYSRDELIRKSWEYHIQFVECHDLMTAVGMASDVILKKHPDIREKLDKETKANMKKIKKAKEILVGKFNELTPTQNPCDSL
jgi:hypothetical protein